ncbi:MAG: mercuric reductase [Ilumatobacter sp.]|nr:mercuric reductase [Ilumatobacter sp.]
MHDYDVIWIGTGQATGTVIPRLTGAGKRVALIEGGEVGGSCVNYGCTPTKTMVASARAAHMARRGADFGVEVPEFSIDFGTVMARMNRMRDNAGMTEWLRTMDGVDFFAEYAHFVSDHEVQVGDRVVSGDTIVIHTGTSPLKLPIDGVDDVDWLDNAGLLELDAVPDHLVIVGGSYIGMEFGQIFRRLGSDVTILEASGHLMPREDDDIAHAAEEILVSEGVTVRTDAKVSSVAQPEPGRVEVSFTVDGDTETITGSHLLLAVGRVPNTAALHLDAAGVQTDQRGYVRVDDVLRTNVEHIYALGDVNGRGAFTHTSVNDGETFWDHYADAGDRRVSDRIPIYAMYIDPPLGRIGMSEREARASGRNVRMATRPMSQIARAKEKDETAGLIKILVDADSEEFLGVAILGVGGDEVINMFAPFMTAGGSYRTFRKAVFTHPTVGELLPWILDDLAPLDD